MGKWLQKATVYLDYVSKLSEICLEQRKMIDEAVKKMDNLAEENDRLKKENEELKEEYETLAVYADKYVGAE